MSDSHATGAGRSARPAIDASALLAWLAHHPPLARIGEADIALDDARALVGQIAEVRRAAVAEASAQGGDIPLSAESIRNAVRPDRELLQSALEILVRDGVSSVASHQLAQGLAPRAPLAAVSRRVMAGLQHLHSDRLSPDEHALLMTARQRATQILPDR